MRTTRICASIYKHCPALLLVLGCLFFQLKFRAQTNPEAVLTYDFNDHKIKEKNNKAQALTRNSVLTYDRFGNEESALQLMGNRDSYFSPGVSPLLKSPDMSVSFWVKINSRVYVGTSFDAIPLLQAVNGPGEDYINALCIAYDYYTNRFSANSTKDSTNEVVLISSDSVIYNKWYHLVIICNSSHFAFYKDNVLVGQIPKTFETKYLETDSMIMGNTYRVKTKCFMRGVVDDIHVFHRELTAKDVEDLYRTPNPNENKKLLNLIYKFAAVVAGLVLIIIALIIRNRRALRKQREELELENRISDLELKAVKAQMNPHFISNCLAAIQDLNYNHDTEKAGLYIAKFSFFLRQILNYSDENYITATQEIEMIRLFVELEQLRFKDGFKFKIDVDETIVGDELLIPALITQPFIENAIWHGLLPLQGIRDPELTVRFVIHNGYPRIEIEDNGVGRDMTKKIVRKRKGTQLVMDKIDTLNRLSKTSHYKIEIIDLVDEQNNNRGTKIVINLDILKE